MSKLLIYRIKAKRIKIGPEEATFFQCDIHRLGALVLTSFDQANNEWNGHSRPLTTKIRLF